MFFSLHINLLTNISDSLFIVVTEQKNILSSFIPSYLINLLQYYYSFTYELWSLLRVMENTRELDLNFRFKQRYKGRKIFKFFLTLLFFNLY
jgi:hypothetical protein